MHPHVSFHGVIESASGVGIAALSGAALYGRGIFTTVRIQSGRPLFWDKHLRRLQRDAKRVGLEFPKRQLLERSFQDLVESNRVDQGRARITLFDERSMPHWRAELPDRTATLITTADLRHATTLKLGLSPYSRNTSSPLAGVKSCSYIENLIAAQESRERGFDEALLTDETGRLSGACFANVFWLIGSKLYTPALSTACLAGTTRESIIENCEVAEVEAQVTAIDSADAIFLTSAGRGVQQVSCYRSKQFQPIEHPILDILSTAK